MYYAHPNTSNNVKSKHKYTVFLLWSLFGLCWKPYIVALHLNFLQNILQPTYLRFTNILLDRLVKCRCHRNLGEHDVLDLTTMDILHLNEHVIHAFRLKNVYVIGSTVVFLGFTPRFCKEAPTFCYIMFHL